MRFRLRPLSLWPTFLIMAIVGLGLFGIVAAMAYSYALSVADFH